MNREGPLLEDLVRRLAETPDDFLAEPLIGSKGSVPVAAVVSDMVFALGGGPLTSAQVKTFKGNDDKIQRNRLGITLIACWLLYDPWFQDQNSLSNLALEFLVSSVNELAPVTQAKKFVNDPERREELARLCLKDLGFRPAGETIAQAQDRLNTLSSVERQRVVRAARVAEDRAHAIREEMIRVAKENATAKVTRE
jgi:hypothetical protein